MNSIEFVIICIFVVLLFLYVRQEYNEVTYVKSAIDGRTYLVRNVKDKQDAADLLATLNRDMLTLIDHMVQIDPTSADVKRLKENYKPDNLSEGSNNSNYTSYSVNKGEQIVMCLRSRDGSERLAKKNTLLYVMIHELAHLMTEDIGHTDTFWKNFKKLLKEAVALKIYRKVDYSKRPERYCGIKITSSVLYGS
jgi:predicted metal-dependent hydrolase